MFLHSYYIIHKNIWIDCIQRLTGPQKLDLSHVILTDTSWDTSVTALKIKRTNSLKLLNSGPCLRLHWDLFASALIQAKHLRCKTMEKWKLGLSENVVIFNIALISDISDDLLMEDMLVKLHISKPFFFLNNNGYSFFFWPSSFYCSSTSALLETQSSIMYLSHLL